MVSALTNYGSCPLVHYYDDCTDIIDINLIDAVKQIVRVNHKSTFTIIPAESNTPFMHPYQNNISCKPNCTDTSLVLNSVKINSNEVKVILEQDMTGNFLKSKFKIPLGDKHSYKIEIDVTKTYSLLEDNLIMYINGYIQHNLKVQMFLQGISVKFIECGTLGSFKTINDRDGFLEKHYTGILYKRQGYIAYLNIK